MPEKYLSCRVQPSKPYPTFPVFPLATKWRASKPANDGLVLITSKAKGGTSQKTATPPPAKYGNYSTRWASERNFHALRHTSETVVTWSTRLGRQAVARSRSRRKCSGRSRERGGSKDVNPMTSVGRI